jgi:CheY-like chemotaxis protein
MSKEQPIVILLVEDEPAHAEIVRRSLAECDIANRLIHTTDGQAALDYLQDSRIQAHDPEHPWPDMILLDLRLPKVDGIDVLRRIKQDESLQGIPVVILSTSSAPADLRKAYQNGAGSFLVKPVGFERFMKLMETFGFYWLEWNHFPEQADGSSPK